MDLSSLARILIIIGCAFIFVGAAVWIFAKVPFLGRLPGDIVIERKTWSLYFPITTCILISIILTLIMWLFGRR